MAEYIDKDKLLDALQMFAPEDLTPLINNLIVGFPAADIVSRQKLDQAVADLRQMVRDNEQSCKLCAHYVKCQEEACPFYESGIGVTMKDGTELTGFQWTCMDFDWGSCRKLEKTPCSGCDFENHWQWRGVKEEEIRR